MDVSLNRSEIAEQSVLGAIMMTNGTALCTVDDLLSPDDFFSAKHKLIYEHLIELDASGEPMDPVTVSESLAGEKLLVKAGGLEYLVKLVQDTSSSSNIRSYALIVRDRSVRRELSNAGQQVQSLSNDSRDTDEILSDAHGLILSVGNADAMVGPARASSWVPEWIDNLDNLSASDSSVAGISTGFQDLDQKINGLQPGQFVVIAGRPSMGKTALAVNIVKSVAIDEKKPTLVFSLEMSATELITRIVSQDAHISMDKLMTGSLDDDDWQKVHESTKKINTTTELYIDDAASITINQIKARARRIRGKHKGIGLIVIDYIQLMRMDGHENRAQQVADVTRGLKTLAKELHCPVIGLSQLNRDVERREDRRPRLSDLKESGSIEQDADVVMFIYRDVVYNVTTIAPHVAEILVAKQRNGPTGTVLLNYAGEYTQFRALDVDGKKQFWSAKTATPVVKRKRGFDDDEF